LIVRGRARGASVASELETSLDEINEYNVAMRIHMGFLIAYYQTNIGLGYGITGTGTNTVRAHMAQSSS
jgi:hypothetical protein